LNGEKKLYWLIAVVIIALVVANVFLVYRTGICGKQSLTYTNTASKEPSEEVKKIIVSGTGYTYARPDLALLTVGVRTESKNAQDAQQQNADKMKSVMDALKANGIAEGDVKTSSYRLEPVMRYDEKPPVLIGYIAENVVQVTIKDVTKSGKIIDVSVSAGANVVQSIQFTTTNERLDELRNSAIADAIQDARQKAENIARSLGVELIGPAEVSLTAGYEPRPLVYELKGAETPILPGELELSISVQATYTFK